MVHVGFQYFGSRRTKCGYEKLPSLDKNLARPRRRWVKSMSGRLRGLRLSRSRKLSVKAFSAVVLLSRIVRIYTDVVDRLNLESIYPATVLPTQWGLPVVSHPSVAFRRSVIPFDRKV